MHFEEALQALYRLGTNSRKHIVLMNIENPSGLVFKRKENLCVWLFLFELFQVECMLITWTVRTMFAYRLIRCIQCHFAVLLFFLIFISLELMSCYVCSNIIWTFLVICMYACVSNFTPLFQLSG